MPADGRGRSRRRDPRSRSAKLWNRVGLPTPRCKLDLFTLGPCAVPSVQRPLDRISFACGIPRRCDEHLQDVGIKPHANTDQISHNQTPRPVCLNQYTWAPTNQLLVGAQRLPFGLSNQLPVEGVAASAQSASHRRR
jgi:hypothetical protein